MSAGTSNGSIAAMEKRLFDQVTTLRRMRSLRPYGMCKILPHLYLGSIFDATDLTQMKTNEITDIVCVHGMRQTDYKNKHYKILYININDSPGENISEHFDKAICFIHEARIKKRTVLVHCLAGVSRSTSIVAAYLVAVTSLSYPLSLSYITQRRPCADPNFGFRMQIYHFANEKLTSIREMLAHKFGKEIVAERRKLDHSAVSSLSDSFTKAELARLVRDEAARESAKCNVAALSPDTSASDLSSTFSTADSKELSFIDDEC